MATLSTPREAARHILIEGKRYRLASEELARKAGERRAWETQFLPRQAVDPRPEFEVPLSTFHQGYGFSYATEAGVYEQANGWDAMAPGILATWPEFTRCESFETAPTLGFIVDYEGYMYVLRGEYAVKFRPVESASEWPIVEYHYFGSTARVAGPPAVFDGDLYVPLQGLTPDTLNRWHRLTTVSNTSVEVQTITQSGSPTGGTWTLTFNDGLTSTTLTALAWNISAADLQTQIRTVPGLAKATVTRSGASNFVWTVTLTAAPGALAATSPPQFTSSAAGLTGGTPAITHATTTAGVADQWDRGPATVEASRLVVYDGKLTRADELNNVSSVSADPMTAGNWGAEYEVGDQSRRITALGVYERFLVVVKENGVFTFDSSAQSIPEPLGIEDVIDEQAGIGLVVAHAFMYIPHRTGWIRWRPGGPYAYVGPEQDGRLEGALAPGWGRVKGVGQYGKTLYVAVQDNANSKGLLVSMTPTGGDRGPYTPHLHHLLDAFVEDVKVVSVTSEAITSHYPSTVVNDATVGTLDWTNPSNISIEDDVRASNGGTAGTTKYLKATGYGFDVPSTATIDGVMAIVSRRVSGGASQVTFSDTGAEQTWVVPAGVTSVQVDVKGAAGSGGGTRGAAGRGGRVQATIVTTPGETLRIYVGRDPATAAAAGYNGGGAGGSNAAGTSGGGGGASDIRQGGAALANRTVVAGGGGGGGALSTGGAGGNGGGTTGGAGAYTLNPGYGGSGGSQTAGGFGPGNGGEGSLGTGGAGGAVIANPPGGGAGGGYYGGGGGSEGGSVSSGGGGGGGGSSYAIGTATGVTHTQGYQSGDGSVTITYVSASSVDDFSVKLVKDGTISGSEMAYATGWGSDEALFVYGSPTDLHGLTLTPDDVNDPTFGIAFATAITGTDITAEIDSLALQVYYSLPAAADPSPFLALLTADLDTKETCTPVIYRLPRYGFTVSTDPTIDRAVAGKEFITPRMHAPSLSVEKVWSRYEFWLDATPESGTPGLQVSARVDDGDWFILETADGREVVHDSGFHEVFFPGDARSVGSYVQLKFAVPALAGDEVAMAVKLRAGMLRGYYQTLRTEVMRAVFVLDDDQAYPGAGASNRSAEEQRRELVNLFKRGSPPRTWQGPDGEKGYCHIPLPQFKEVAYVEGEPSAQLAIVDIRKVPFV